MALTETGDVLAAHVFDSWSPDGPPEEWPTFAQLLGHTDLAAAVALFKHDLRAFRADRVEVRLVFDADAPDPLGDLREAQQQVLGACGFDMEVDRIRLEWLGSPAPHESLGLEFRAASTVAEQDLLDVFAAVGDGSVDHGMVGGRAELGRVGEAQLRLGRARRREYRDDWFAVAIASDGCPVGYVQSALTAGRAILAEVGVVEPLRGHRLVDDLLAYGTGILVRCGQRRIRAFTDAHNRAMRAAFSRCGYRETGERRDFRRVGTASGTT